MSRVLTPSEAADFLSDNWKIAIEEDLPRFLSPIPDWGMVVPWRGLQVLVSAPDAAGIYHLIDITDSPALVAGMNVPEYSSPDASVLHNVAEIIREAEQAVLDAAGKVPDLKTSLELLPWLAGIAILIAVWPSIRPGHR